MDTQAEITEIQANSPSSTPKDKSDLPSILDEINSFRDSEFNTSLKFVGDSVLVNEQEAKCLPFGSKTRKSYELTDNQVIKTGRSAQSINEIYLKSKFKDSPNLPSTFTWGQVSEKPGEIYLIEDKISPLPYDGENITKSKLPQLKTDINRELSSGNIDQAKKLISQWGLREITDVDQLDNLFQFAKDKLRLVDSNLHQIGYDPKGNLVIFDFGSSAIFSEEEPSKFVETFKSLLT